MNLPVIHRPERQRFEATVDGHLSEATYELRDGIMHMTHTVVPDESQGRGIAAALVRAAFDHAQAHGLKVNPLCSYVRQYVQRHPETGPLLAPEA